MCNTKKLIWKYLSMKRQLLDNDYYFYEDGSIFHHYDKTITKLNIEEYVSSEDISESDKQTILSKCKEECNNETYVKIERILSSTN